MIKTIGLFLLMLLQAAGWLLLALFVLLLAVLLLVCFVPVRYDIRVHNERIADPEEKNPVKNISIQVKISWLLHLIHVTFSYGPKGFVSTVKAAGIDVLKALAWLSDRKQVRQSRKRQRGRKKNQKADSNQSPGGPQQADSGCGQGNLSRNQTDAASQGQEKTSVKTAKETPVEIPNDIQIETPADTEKETSAETPADIEKETPANTAETSADTEEISAETPADTAEEIPADIDTDIDIEKETSVKKAGEASHALKESAEIRLKNTAEIPAEAGQEKLSENAGNKTKQETESRSAKQRRRQKKASSQNSGQKKDSHKEPRSGKTGGITDKIRQVYKEYKDETNRLVLGHLWKELCCLIRSYKPRKFEADITFSLSDPALTGGVLGILSLIPAVYRYPCSLIPDFESEKLYLEGSLVIRGKVTVYVFLLSMLRLVRDREFMKIVKRLMKRR